MTTKPNWPKFRVTTHSGNGVHQCIINRDEALKMLPHDGDGNLSLLEKRVVRSIALGSISSMELYPFEKSLRDNAQEAHRILEFIHAHFENGTPVYPDYKAGDSEMSEAIAAYMRKVEGGGE